MAARTHPPAWYPDPGHPERVRRWDGRAWTGDTRPLPDHLRTVRLSPGPPARVRRSSHALWLSAAVLALGAVAMLSLSGRDADPADRIADAAFVRQAGELCTRTERQKVRPLRQDQQGEAEAQRIATLATTWEAMVVELRGIPVAAAEVGKVERWLQAWDAWNRLGHDYASALAGGDDVAAQRTLDASVRAKRTINDVAYASGMDACAP